MGKRSEQTPHQRRDTDGKYAYEKMPKIMSLGNCKLKQQWDTTAYLLVRLKYRTLTTPNAGKNVEQQTFIH